VDPYRNSIRNYKPEPFSNQVLGMSGTCSLSYAGPGEPLSIVLEESGVKTTCNLTTYMPESPEPIPFDMEDLSFKIITQSRWLLDALAEIAPTAPEKLTFVASRKAPFLRLVSVGDLGSSTVDFAQGRDLLETFFVAPGADGASDKWMQTFKFSIIKSATEAMRISSKISLRGDGQGVLSMQFMVEVEGGGVNFLDFRFVPYAQQDEDGDADEPPMDGGDDERQDAY
jgi:cell cycle checkpoint protein